MDGNRSIASILTINNNQYTNNSINAPLHFTFKRRKIQSHSYHPLDEHNYFRTKEVESECEECNKLRIELNNAMAEIKKLKKLCDKKNDQLREMREKVKKVEVKKPVEQLWDHAFINVSIFYLCVFFFQTIFMFH